MRKIFILVVFLFFKPEVIYSWVYPEHRDIAVIAIENLSPEYRNLLELLWSEARKNYEFRLTESVIDGKQGEKPEKLDFASWPAISADHSTSAENLLYNVLQTDWILKVADITAHLKYELNRAADRDERINALRESDLQLQKADEEYVSRAGSNNVHFLLSLPDVRMNSNSYLDLCLKEGTELNAIGTYVWYHHKAMTKISKLNSKTLNENQRASIILAALADEAFALHFLEDVFAAGHAAGTWGDASQRKGTHDYYNENGLRITTWEGNSFVLTGDAWMRFDDAQRTSVVIRMSLEQFLDAAGGSGNILAAAIEPYFFAPDTFNVCANNFNPPLEVSEDFRNLLLPVYYKTPIPGLQIGLGKLPMFRAELGTFIGFTPALRGSILSGGFGTTQETAGVSGGIEASVRLGVGLDGVLNESGDGLVFLEFGWRQDGSSSTGVINDPETQIFGNLLAAIPGRSAISTRIRLPFYVIPGDLLITAPFLLLFSPETIMKMGTVAVNGGLIPWQAGMATSIGRFQFILGREIGIYFFGRTKERDALFNVTNDENGVPRTYILSYRSTQFEFPILVYRPFRSFEMDQRSSLFIQLYGGFDIPENVENLTYSDDNIAPELKTVWYLGARVVFDWRHYF